MYHYGKQYIDQDDIDQVVNVLKSDYLTQGPTVDEFEKGIASYCNVKYAVSYNSATSALHATCYAIGLQQGDIVWTSPVSFVASSNCALYLGCNIDFVDVNEATANIDVQKLSLKLEESAKVGRMPKALILVHMAGNPCEMEDISKLASKYNFTLIEDASHALGGEYNGKKIGNCFYSDITIFSFHPLKMITTGEGGMATTNSMKLKKRLKLFSSHGITKNPEEFIKKSENEPWKYEQIDLGYNYRMTDISAALGLSQLSKLDEFVDKRNNLAKRYIAKLDSKIISQQVSLNNKSSYHLFLVRLPIDVNRFNVFKKLQEKNIYPGIHYIPIYKQPFYSKFGFNEKDFPGSEAYYGSCLSLPLHFNLQEQDIDYICKTINTYI
jgi:UDP-4-amino-4,6-dideoxy-N-acetyl-beta-L-altrosamine transaminase